jgi:hypothetical protein
MFPNGSPFPLAILFQELPLSPPIDKIFQHFHFLPSKAIAMNEKLPSLRLGQVVLNTSQWDNKPDIFTLFEHQRAPQ